MRQHQLAKTYKRVICTALFSWLCFTAYAAAAQPVNPQDPAAAQPARVVSVEVKNGALRVQGECGIGDLILVKLEPGNIKLLAEQARASRQALGLFMDGWFLKGIAPLPEPGESDTLRFLLTRNDENKEAWNQILGRRFLISNAPTPMTVGLEGGGEVARSSATIQLKLMPALKAACLFVSMVAFLLVMGYLTARTSLLRDSAETFAAGRLAAFSLGRTQMAFWFVNTVVAYLFIWAVTGTSAALSNSVLALIGIGSGTALGGVVIDRSKQDARDRVKAVSAPAAPSRNFLIDLLQDGESFSVSRLQMVVWTLVMFFIFWGAIIHTLAMPEFDNSSLTLMGISAGTYLGFKLPEEPEQQSDPTTKDKSSVAERT